MSLVVIDREHNGPVCFVLYHRYYDNSGRPAMLRVYNDGPGALADAELLGAYCNGEAVLETVPMHGPSQRTPLPSRPQEVPS